MKNENQRLTSFLKREGIGQEKWVFAGFLKTRTLGSRAMVLALSQQSSCPWKISQ